MKSKAITKKILMGKFKGKNLKLPSKETTRSSKSIVLESFFNTIQFDIIDASFVEVFSGSGSIGLEALSRGASHVLFMEQDREALKVLRENIAQTDPSSCQVFAGDSFVNITEVIKTLNTIQCHSAIKHGTHKTIADGQCITLPTWIGIALIGAISTFYLPGT